MGRPWTRCQASDGQRYTRAMGAALLVDASVIHFSATFPVRETPCGKVGPGADRWSYVTCVACLAAGPDDPRIRARFVALSAAPANDTGLGGSPEGVAGIRPPLDDATLTAYLERLGEERARMATEIQLAMPKRRRR